MLGVRTSTYEFWGDTHIQSLTDGFYEKDRKDIFLCWGWRTSQESIIKDTEEGTWAIGTMTIKSQNRALDHRRKGKVLVPVEMNTCRGPGRKFQPDVGGRVIWEQGRVRSKDLEEEGDCWRSSCAWRPWIDKGRVFPVGWWCLVWVTIWPTLEVANLLNYYCHFVSAVI